MSTQLLIAALVAGSVYALIALGLNLVYGTMRLINVAHGEVVMIGAYVAYWGMSLPCGRAVGFRIGRYSDRHGAWRRHLLRHFPPGDAVGGIHGAHRREFAPGVFRRFGDPAERDVAAYSRPISAVTGTRTRSFMSSALRSR